MTLDLNKIKAAAIAATQGEWIVGDDEDSDFYLVGPHDDGLVSMPIVKLHSEANANYIATANPQAVLELITRLEAAESRWAVVPEGHTLVTSDRYEELLTAEKDAAKYQELIYAVGRKFPTETRHETALKYIRQMEEPSKNAAMKESEEC